MRIFRYYLPSAFLIILLAFVLQSCFDSTGPKTTPDQHSYSHIQPAGTAANDFLADSNFTDLVVEIDYMPGYAPNERALDSLKAFFQQRLHKKSITIEEPSQIPSGGQDKYSANEIRDIEEERRSTFTQGDTLAAYFMIVDGKYQKRDLLGIAYYNTSNAFFGPSYDEASSGIGSPSRYQIEALSFRHEFGHLFGLVAIPNSGTEMVQENHKSQDHGNHCDNDQCLMYYATEVTDLVGNTFSNEIPPLDANCIADLQGNGGK